jgi:hypothetical protein
MKTDPANHCDKDLNRNLHLLDRLRAARANVGDGLNDIEFTLFLQHRGLPAEAGFGFICFSDGFVTLSVPPQDLSTWYPDKGWIRVEKEQIARAIAAKYSIALCEPPDHAPQFVLPSSTCERIHHHLEMTANGQTAVIAHPQYLKIRVFGSTGRSHFSCSQHPLPLHPELLRDLSALYES